MIDHISLYPVNFEKSKIFYTQILSALGYTPIKEFDVAIGFGIGEKPSFWLIRRDELPSNKMHVAFSAHSREEVNLFHQKGLEIGGKELGAPGERPYYHPDYYGAFIEDPDGHNIEAVIRKK